MRNNSLRTRLETLEAGAPKRESETGWEAMFKRVFDAVFLRPGFKSPPTQEEWATMDAWLLRVVTGKASEDDARILAEVAQVWQDVPGSDLTFMRCIKAMSSIIELTGEPPAPGDISEDELLRQLDRHGIQYTVVRVGPAVDR